MTVKAINAELVARRLAARELLEVVHAVARLRGVLAADLCGRARTKAVSRARQEAWWLLRTDPARAFSYADIARLWGRDHTTVLAGIAAHEQRLRYANPHR